MKKFFALALALVLTLALSVTCFAANATGLKPSETATGDVKATYAATANDTTAVYSVDVEFGGMSFTYTDAAKTWNPENHQYELQGGATGAWTCATDANKITVTNHSNAAVTAALTYTAENTYNTVTGSFDKATLNLGSAAENNAAVSASAYLTLAGTLASGTTAQKVGTITVTIAAK
jgi:hypothetical protein